LQLQIKIPASEANAMAGILQYKPEGAKGDITCIIGGCELQGKSSSAISVFLF